MTKLTYMRDPLIKPPEHWKQIGWWDMRGPIDQPVQRCFKWSETPQDFSTNVHISHSSFVIHALEYSLRYLRLLKTALNTYFSATGSYLGYLL